MDSIVAFDSWLFTQINGFVGAMPLFDRFMSTMVNEYFITVTLSLVVFSLWFTGASQARRLSNQRAVIYAILAEVVANSMITVNNALYYRPRPFATMQVKMLFYEPTDSSMPSNPAAVAFAFATAVWLVNRRVGALLYGLAVLFAVSRVYCGVHFPLDVVGGALVGATGAVIAVALGRRWLSPGIDWLINVGRRVYLA